MATAVTAGKSELRRSLSVIKGEIRQLLKEADEAAAQAVQPYWSEIGDLLVEAKGQFLEEGKTVSQFYAWTSDSFGFSQTQTRRYEKSVDVAPQNRAAHPTLSSALNSTGQSPRGRHGYDAPWRGAVIDNIERARREAEQFEAQERTRAEEREAVTKLASRIIDIGYRVLAKELHPDKKGGSKEAFNRLKQAHEQLKKCIGG